MIALLFNIDPRQLQQVVGNPNPQAGGAAAGGFDGARRLFALEYNAL